MNLSRKRRWRRLTRSVKLKLPPLTVTNPSMLLWFVSLLYLFGVVYLLIGPVFRVHRFACAVDNGTQCPDFVIPELMKSTGEIIFLVQPEPIEKKLKTNLPDAESVQITKQFPDRLSTTIVWQYPVANLSIPASSSAYVVGSRGDLITVLGSPDPALPVIVASSAADLIISDRLTEPSLTAALEILKYLTTASVRTTRINIVSSQDIRVYLSNNVVAVFSSSKPIRPQVLRLQLILTQTTMNQEWPFIDLRYDRPTLKKTL